MPEKGLAWIGNAFPETSADSEHDNMACKLKRVQFRATNSFSLEIKLPTTAPQLLTAPSKTQ